MSLPILGQHRLAPLYAAHLLDERELECKHEITSPGRYYGAHLCLSTSYHSSVLDRSLTLNQNRQKVRKSIYWCSINVVIWAILVFDIYHTTVYNLGYYHYIEYVVTLILTANIVYYLLKILSTPTKSEQILITKEQQKLLGIKDTDSSFKIVDKLSPTCDPFFPCQTPQKTGMSSVTSTPSPVASTPMNMTSTSWMSNFSPSDSLNYSMSSPSWTYQPGSPGINKSTLHTTEQTSPMWLPQKTTDTDFIRDEKTLDEYLRNYVTVENVNNLNTTPPQSTNLLSSFWSHPVTKTAKDMSMFLRRCQYQLSSQLPSSSPLNKSEDKSSPVSPQKAQADALQIWTRINVDSVALTQWNENLRKWISQTILERLAKEFDSINEALEKKCMIDIKIGAVGLDRLRKTAHMMPVAQVIPSLATLIPFLEVHPNQEYVVKRIRELAKGGCMSEFKWNGGSSYNGKEWDDSLPTDCEIIMHLLASYLDTQLMPVPNMPDTKPFSGHYYIKYGEKIPPLTPMSLYIQQFSEKPPHYRVIVGEKIYEMVKGYNNLFHSILFFLYHANKMECGMLGRVNLGRAGLNMLWIIGQQ